MTREQQFAKKENLTELVKAYEQFGKLKIVGKINLPETDTANPNLKSQVLQLCLEQNRIH